MLGGILKKGAMAAGAVAAGTLALSYLSPASLLIGGLAGGQMYMQRQAEKEATRGRKLDLAGEVEKNRKAQMNTLRAIRIKGAALSQMAQNTGSTGSGLAGGLSSLAHQGASSIGQQQLASSNAMGVSQFNQASARYSGYANMFETGGNIAGYWFDQWNKKRLNEGVAGELV